MADSLHKPLILRSYSTTCLYDCDLMCLVLVYHTNNMIISTQMLELYILPYDMCLCKESKNDFIANTS